MATYCSGITKVYPVNFRGEPEIIDQYENRYRIIKMVFLDEHRLALVTGSGRLVVWDIARKRTYIDKKSNCLDIEVLPKKGMLYQAAKKRNRIELYDFQTKWIVSSFLVEGKPLKLMQHEGRNLLYVLIRTYGKKRQYILKRYDISDPFHPKQLPSSLYGNEIPAIQKIYKNMIVAWFGMKKEFRIYDLALRLVKTIPLENNVQVRNFHIRDGRIFIAAGKKGLTIVNIK